MSNRVLFFCTVMVCLMIYAASPVMSQEGRLYLFVAWIVTGTTALFFANKADDSDDSR